MDQMEYFFLALEQKHTHAGIASHFFFKQINTAITSYAGWFVD
jgi:hypothetical protein